MYDMKQVVINYKVLAGQIKSELDIQWTDGRIKGTEYADVFNKLMSQAIQLSFDSPLKDQQTLQAIEQTGLIEAQKLDQEYVTQHIRPIEKQKITCEVELCTAQTELVRAQAADQEYVTVNIRPTEMNIKIQELEIAKEKAAIARIETDIKVEELAIKRIELDIAREKLRQAEKDVAYKEAQTAFTIRQTEGFDDSRKQKMLDAQLNAWAMMFSSGLLDQVPSVINQCMVDGLYNMMAGEVGAPTSGNCQAPARNVTIDGLTPCEEKALNKMREEANESNKSK